MIPPTALDPADATMTFEGEIGDLGVAPASVNVSVDQLGAVAAPASSDNQKAFQWLLLALVVFVGWSVLNRK